MEDVRTLTSEKEIESMVTNGNLVVNVPTAVVEPNFEWYAMTVEGVSLVDVIAKFYQAFPKSYDAVRSWSQSLIQLLDLHPSKEDSMCLSVGNYIWFSVEPVESGKYTVVLAITE